MSSVDDLKMSSAELNRIVQNTANHHALGMFGSFLPPAYN